MSCEIYCPGSDFDVHQIVNNSTLNMPFVLMNRVLRTGIEYLQETVRRFQVFIYRFILLLVMLDPFNKVVIDLVLVVGNIIRAGNLHLSDVTVNDFVVIAQRFNKKQFETFKTK